MSWYETNNDVSWYSPNYRPRAERSAAYTAPQPNRAKPSAPLPGGRKTRIRAIIIIALIVAAAVLVAIFGGGKMNLPDPTDDDGTSTLPNSWHTYYEDLYGTETVSPISKSKLPKAADRGNLSLSLSSGGASLEMNEIYQKCAPSVVGIKCFEGKDERSYSWGTGIVASADGYIITNAHVIDSGVRASVETYDGKVYEAKLVGADVQSDIAVLKIDAEGLQAATFASAESVSVGDTVCAIGNPYSPDYSFSMTRGIISATSRQVGYNGSVMNLLQTDTSINEGNSGGPLINERGQVIGITNMKMVSNMSSIEGMGFAIPSDTVKTVVNALVKDGAVYGRAVIGITTGPIAPDIAKYYDIPVGLYVADVLPKSDAAAQGLKKGDIITKVFDKEASSNSVLAEARDAHKIGDKISVTVWRDGETLQFDIKIKDGTEIYE